MRKLLLSFLLSATAVAIGAALIESAELPETKSSFTIARLQYGGGGDWYGNQTSINNLLQFIRSETSIDARMKEGRVSVMDEDFFSYPYLYMTGHGNVHFRDDEVKRLRQHLTSGGFLHADDNYGMDESFRREIKKVFPGTDLVELPFDHLVYHSWFSFPGGLPKIHEHDGGPPNGYGLFYEGRLVVFYSFNTDLGDGWEDPKVHNDPVEKRLAALRMGTNIVVYALTN